MTYWHMQLHPDEQNWKKEKEILEQLSIIGLGGEKDSLKVIQFEREMRIGDIVLIKRGAESIALVEVTGDCEDKVDWDFDWFYYRRTVKVLEFSEPKNKKPFPLPRGTLKKSVNSGTDTYKYIDEWYLSVKKLPVLNEAIPASELDRVSTQFVKIKSVHIESYKALKKFDISFSNDNDMKDIIVLAGINGCGKTTILEYLHKGFFNELLRDELKNDLVKISINGSDFDLFGGCSSQNGLGEYRNNVHYFPVTTEVLDLSSAIYAYLEKLIFDYDYKPTEAHEKLREDIDFIFKYGLDDDAKKNKEERFDFNLGLNFYDIDMRRESHDFTLDGESKTSRISFENDDGMIFNLDFLSTGEKNLLSKLLYMYLKEIKGSVILIDEPEMFLHPNWQMRIYGVYAKFAEKFNNQIIMATHSPQLIASVPYKNRILLRKENGKIRPFHMNQPPSGVDVNSILSEIMGADPRPPELLKLYAQYRKFVEERKENTPEALAVKAQLSEESDHSQFMQEMSFLIELRDL
jgi:predicted ATPase